MGRIKLSLLSVSAIVLLAGNSVFAQSSPTSISVTNDQLPQTTADMNKLVPEDTYTLPWAPVKEDNILWKKRVWRDIDAADAGNEAFGSKPDAPLNSTLSRILIEGFFAGKYKAYSAVDDRFTTELSVASFIDLLASKNGFNPENVTQFRIKEDWLFLEKEHKMVVRVMGIAPIVQVHNADGTTTAQPAFWVYYPDVRTSLSGHKVYATNSVQGMNWDQLFESRSFNGKIEKVSGGYQPYRNWGKQLPVSANK